jgi:hypothetical protein
MLRQARLTLIRVTVMLSAVTIVPCMLASSGACQYAYLDTNEDTYATGLDVLRADSINVVDVWLDTDSNGDGSPARGSSEENELMTFNSYEIILRAEGGTVEFGTFTNLQPTMQHAVDSHKNDTEMHVGFVGMEILPPGKYHLGRVAVRVTGGSPSLSFGSHSIVDPHAHTSFGSKWLGIDDDNTLKLSDGSASASSQAGSVRAENDAEREAYRRSLKGDWKDTSTLRAATAQIAGSFQSSKDPTRVAFGAWVEGTGKDLKLRVSTTRVGQLRMSLFDVRGRLVKSANFGGAVAGGVYEWNLGPGSNTRKGISSGVYFYRVTAEEGTKQGRVVLVR